MALHKQAVQLIAPYLKDAKVLSLGYPDLAISFEQAEEIFGVMPKKSINRGGAHGKAFLFPETASLMDQLGVEFECVDIARLTHVEKIVDLNYPVDLGEFDLVIDPGTTEHCFNIGQAIINAANAVKVGGRILHLSPVTMVNHGFYCPCPTLWHDFYDQNGFTVEHYTIRLEGGDFDAGSLIGKEAQRYKLKPEAGICFLAKRNREDALIYPVQSKYKAMLETAQQ